MIMKTAYILTTVLLISLFAGISQSHAAADIMIADFEGENYGNWQVEGTAFGKAPAKGAIAAQQQVEGFLGKGLVNTYLAGDPSEGTLTSQKFKIERKFINFLVGGGSHAETCIRLMVNGKPVRRTSGKNKELLEWAAWDVSEFRGKMAQVEIQDRARGGWGHINADNIFQSDQSKGPVSRDKASAGNNHKKKPESRDKALAESSEQILKPMLEKLDFDEIIFTVRQNGKDGHWYANFSYWVSNPGRSMYGDFGKLCKLNIRTGEAEVILDAPNGSMRDPQMHYDGKKILFSYRKDGQPYYHLYEINVDGTGLRQITDGPYDDLEPAYLPDGGIVFCSSRCNRFVQCFFVRVAIVYRCDADGNNIRALSANMEQDNTPWVLPDGRILYQRWEYIDRSQVRYHHLWTMNPDGADQMVYFGNMHGGTVMIDAKPIPDTKEVLVSFSPGHGRSEHEGVVTIVDPSNGPDDKAMAKSVVRQQYRDPYPITRDLFMAAGKTHIDVMDREGHVMKLYELPEEWRANGMGIQEPRPVRKRSKEQVIPSRVDLSKPTGQVFLENVYIGRKMEGVEKGDIKKLLVMEVLPKPVNFSGGMEPLTMGGSFTMERILGTVPVEEDGSANFELPAMRSLFFVALDENDMSVKRMQSFMTVQPGEIVSCVGCHEERLTAPRSSKRTIAMVRKPSKIAPITDVPEVFDFPRDIQPILDKNCVCCHGYEKTDRGGPRSGGVILTGDRGRMYSHSYVTLTKLRQFADGRNGEGNRAPRSIGSSASPIMQKLEGKHKKMTVKMNASAHDKKMVRLWIDSAACYPGTYAALGTGSVGVNRGGLDAIMKKRCVECHKIPRVDDHTGFNLTRPEKTWVLLKALSPKDGGIGMMKTVKKDGKEIKELVYAFENKEDPDYKAMLEVVQKCKASLDKVKRFDMAGFRPNEHYIREMQVYGILPDSLAADAPVDPYKTDRDYWKSLWYYPPAQ